MNRYKKLLVLLLVLLGLGVGYKSFKDKPRLSSTEKSVQQQTATLSINGGVAPQGFEVSGYIGKTALEATQAVTQVEASGTGANAFVTGLNGRKADTKKHEFWELDANGAQTQVGAGSYVIKNGDQLEWKISTY